MEEIEVTGKIIFRIPEDLERRVRRISRETGIPVSEIIRRSLEKWADDAEKELEDFGERIWGISSQ